MSKLATKARALLTNRPRPITYAHIKERTGLNPRWLEAFAAGKIDDPSCSKVETLYEFLSGETLNV